MPKNDAMPKNIVLCSDGTGNKGGSGPDTNVFKLYNAVKARLLKDAVTPREQVIYYDNGVGTSSFAPLRFLGGVVGLGFRRNVRDLYEFTARHYQNGDDIYCFGFSRGAATVRAFAGMIQHCGLVRKHTGLIDEHGNEILLKEDEFQRQIEAAMKSYVRRDRELPFYKKFSIKAFWEFIFRPDQKYDRYDGSPVKIEFMGIWDTVAAIGIPQIPWFDNFLELIRRHRFYDYEPRGVVNNVCHAVAVDDERRTFWPLIWDEKNLGEGQHVEQVWFPGVHSNVGGGYPRDGLASVTLDWMLERLKEHKKSLSVSNNDRGLSLIDGFHQAVADAATPHGKMYDSRSGLALYYRYQPRVIADRYKGQLGKGGDAPILIHQSVLDRMALRTADYGPGRLPDKFTEVKTRGSGASSLDSPRGISIDLTNKAEWGRLRAGIDFYTNLRIILYGSFILSTVLLVIASLVFWNCGKGLLSFTDCSILPNSSNWLLLQIADTLNYGLPDMFKNIVDFAVLKKPLWSAGFISVVMLYFVIRQIIRGISEKISEKARVEVMKEARP